MAHLTEPINLNKLKDDGVEFKIDPTFIKTVDSDSEDDDNSPKPNKCDQSNFECVGLFDEDNYEEGLPFEIIAKKMFNLLPDGKIKKRVIEEGSGEKPLEKALVKIHYNAYVEYDDEPFDSTYIRNRPNKFTLDSGEVLPGLDFAVQSMKVNEKSQFLIHPNYAYGNSCLIGRVPPNSTVLFEVKLLEVVNCGAAITYENLTEDQQNMFSEVYKYCTALCERGKRSFKDDNDKNAIKDYNTAVCRLQKATLTNYEEIEKHRELSLKLYSNLLVCYTRSRQPKKGCANAEKIYNLTQNGELAKISAKVYFNHAKCLRFLGEYETAKHILAKAYRMEPNNPEIANEMLSLDQDKQEQRKKEALLATALLKG